MYDVALHCLTKIFHILKPDKQACSSSHQLHTFATGKIKEVTSFFLFCPLTALIPLLRPIMASYSLDTCLLLTAFVVLSPGPFHTSGLTGLQHTINMDGRDEFIEDNECCSNNSQEVQGQDSLSGTGWRDGTGVDGVDSVGTSSD